MRYLSQLKNDIHEKINLRSVVSNEIRSKARSNTTRDIYCCPFHDEKTGSFVVWDDHYCCFGACHETGDAIQFIERLHNMEFVQAVRYLHEKYIGGDVEMTPPERSEKQQTIKGEPPANEWQSAARRIIERAQETLWGDDTRALDYLRKRGLTDATIERAKLGYVPGHYMASVQMEGLKVFCGILIPWIANDAVWGLKVRRAAGDLRYIQVGGGKINQSLYNADNVIPGTPLVVTEGEFDCLIAMQAGDPVVSAVAIGSSSNTQMASRWYRFIAAAPKLYILMDGDGAGNEAEGKLTPLTDAARIIHVPTEYDDINDMYIKAGSLATEAWLDSVTMGAADATT